MVAVEKFFDDGENILGGNPDFTFSHFIEGYNISDFEGLRSDNVSDLRPIE